MAKVNGYERPPKEEWMQPKPTHAQIRKLYKAFGGNSRSGNLPRLFKVIDEAYRKAFPTDKGVVK